MQWAWLVPWLSSGIAAGISDVTRAERLSYFLTGLLAGVIWQLLHRRDLTSRLTFMAVLVTVGVVTILATGGEFNWQDMDTVGLHAIGIVLGLIYTEHYQRWRDRTAWRRQLRAKQDSELAAP